MSQSILSNAAVATTGRIVNAGLGIVVTWLITRYIGAEQFGVYTVLLSFGTIVQLVADFGLYLTLSNEIPHHPDGGKLLSQVVSLRAVLLLLFFAIATPLISYVPAATQMWPIFLITALGLSFQSISQLLMSVYQYERTVWRATLGDLAGRAMQILLIVWSALTTITLTRVMAAFAIGSGVSTLLHRLLLSLYPIRFHFNWKLVKRLIATSWPLGAMLVMNAVYFRIDSVILSLFRSSAEVGWYGLAYRIVESSLFFPAMLGGLLLPRLSEAVKKSPQDFRQYIQEGLKIVFLASAGIVPVLLVKSGPITQFFGNDFAPAGQLLSFLAFSVPILFVGQIVGFALVALQRQKLLLGLYTGLALLNTVANLVMIPRWGAIAAALTTIGTEGTAVVVALVLIGRAGLLSISLRYAIRAGIVAVTVGAAAAALPPSVGLVGILIATSLSFLIASWGMRLFNRQEFSLLVR